MPLRIPAVPRNASVELCPPLKTSGPLLVNFVSLRTALDATIVEAMAAGTLKMIDITGLRLSNMNTVAIKFARKLQVYQLRYQQVGTKSHLRNHEVDKSIAEDKLNEP